MNQSGSSYPQPLFKYNTFVIFMEQRSTGLSVFCKLTFSLGCLEATQGEWWRTDLWWKTGLWLRNLELEFCSYSLRDKGCQLVSLCNVWNSHSWTTVSEHLGQADLLLFCLLLSRDMFFPHCPKFPFSFPIVWDIITLELNWMIKPFFFPKQNNKTNLKCFFPGLSGCQLFILLLRFE